MHRSVMAQVTLMLSSTAYPANDVPQSRMPNNRGSGTSSMNSRWDNTYFPNARLRIPVLCRTHLSPMTGYELLMRSLLPSTPWTGAIPYHAQLNTALATNGSAFSDELEHPACMSIGTSSVQIRPSVKSKGRTTSLGLFRVGQPNPAYSAQVPALERGEHGKPTLLP